MLSDKELEVLENNIEKHGFNRQIDKAIEEMAELTQALMKLRHNGTEELIHNATEEMADTYITLKQIEMISGNRNLINVYIHEKIERLRLRNEAQDDGTGV